MLADSEQQTEILTLLLPPIFLGLIVVAVVLAIKGKGILVTAGLGFLQGLGSLAYAIIGAPPNFFPLGDLAYVIMGGPPNFHLLDYGWARRTIWVAASVGVILIAVQGVLMLIFSIATCKRKAWGAWGLSAVALFFNLVSEYTNGTPGWILIPLLIYLGGAISLSARVGAP
jgi:hypothetical protein